MERLFDAPEEPPEETRVAEQARPALASEEHGRHAHALSETQEGLQGRVEKVGQRIRELPDGEAEFARERLP